MTDQETKEALRVRDRMLAQFAERKALAVELMREVGTLRGQNYVLVHVESTAALERRPSGKYGYAPTRGDLVGTLHLDHGRASSNADVWNTANPDRPVRIITRRELLEEIVAECDEILAMLGKTLEVSHA